ncbi:MAG: hypothetical protein QF464_22110, partial [Myxococcota bacterium]|nr:hypothetical protein [Myxococcota bacterium]
MPAKLGFGRLIRQGLMHHWRGHLAVALGVAIAGAVLVGSLVVGDSVGASLRAQVSERLGTVEVVVVAPGEGVRAALAGELGEALGPEAIVANVLRRSAVLGDPGGSKRVVGVELLGVTPTYWRALGREVPARVSNTLRPNERLAEALGLEAGSEVVVRVGEGGAASVDAPMALAPNTIPAGVLTVGPVAEGLAGDFTLDVHGRAPLTALVPLAWLSELAGDDDARANTLLVRGADEDAIRAALKETWRLADMGLTVSKAGSGYALRSDAILLPRPVFDAESSLSLSDPHTDEVLTWFADTLRAGDREVPYSFVAAVWRRDDWQPGDDPVLEPLRHNEIAVNRWLAEQLQVSTGDTVEL